MSDASVLTQNFLIISDVLESVSVLLGVGLTFGGLMQLKKHGEQRSMMSSQHGLAGPLMMLVCGAMLLILPKFLGAVLIGFWGSQNDMCYDCGGGGTYEGMIQAIIILVRVIGVGSFIRGVFLLSRMGGQHSQPGHTGKALMHILAGVLCIHIVNTIQLLKELLNVT